MAFFLILCLARHFTPLPTREGLGGGSVGCGSLLSNRQRDDEAGALPYFRFHTHIAIVLVDDGLHDGKADAGAGLVVASLIERIEDFLAVFLADACPVVGDADAERLTVGSHRAGEPNLVVRVLGSIGHKVADDLGDAFLVDHRREVVGRIVDMERDVALLQGGLEALGDGLHEVGNGVAGEMHREALLLHLVEVEQLVDQREQPVGIAVDDVEEVGQVGGRKIRSIRSIQSIRKIPNIPTSQTS